MEEYPFRVTRKHSDQSWSTTIQVTFAVYDEIEVDDAEIDASVDPSEPLDDAERFIKERLMHTIHCAVDSKVALMERMARRICELENSLEIAGHELQHPDD